MTTASEELDLAWLQSAAVDARHLNDYLNENNEATRRVRDACISREALNKVRRSHTLPTNIKLAAGDAYDTIWEAVRYQSNGAETRPVPADKLRAAQKALVSFLLQIALDYSKPTTGRQV